MLYRQLSLRRMCGLAVAGFAALVFCSAACDAGCGGCAQYSCPGNPGYGNVNCCNVIWGPPLPSPLDTPLRCYFMPRRPAWGGQQYRYQTKPDMDYCACGPGGEGAMGYPAGPRGLAPELYDSFAPLDFEQIGQIPNTSPREMGGAVPAGH